MKRILLPLITLLLCLACEKEPPGVVSDTFDGVPVDPAPVQWDGVRRGNITYQVLVYSFADGNGDGIGEFAGLTDKLEYLESLGHSAV